MGVVFTTSILLVVFSTSNYAQAATATALTPATLWADLAKLSSNSTGQLSLKADAPKRYEVKRGDSLWSIATRFLDDPWMWPQLWQANKQLANPHVLYPGDILELLDTTASLSLAPRLRILTLQEPVPLIPVDTLNAFLNLDVVTERRDFEEALYTVSIQGGRSLGSQGDVIEALGELDPQVQTYTIYRDLEEVRDPLTRLHLGFHARALGSARLIQAAGERAQLEITHSQTEIQVGDRLLPHVGNPFVQGLQPHKPSNPVHGLLMGGLAAQQQIVQFEPVMLNLGADQLQPGALLEVLAPGKRRRDYASGEVVFAGENSKGTLIVYRVFATTSFALVIHSKEPLLAGDVFRQLGAEAAL